MSLKQDLQRRIIDGMIKASKSDNDYVVLILDPHTTKIISSCARVYDVMDAGVVVLENLLVDRERVDMPAVYFIEPSPTSVERLVKDFSGRKPQYPFVHIYFTTRCSEELMHKIQMSNVPKYAKTLKELNCDFIALESRVFSFNRSDAIRNLFLRGGATQDYLRLELQKTSKQLASVCITLHEYPYIRYMGNSRQCQYLANFLEDDLNKLVAVLPKWEADTSRERGTLLIVDRSLDPAAPLMHEYTYQAMVNDLLPIDGELLRMDKVKQDVKDDPEASNTILLSEDDALWTELRHQHIGEAMQTITKKFNEFRGKNAVAAMRGKTQDASLSDMRKVMQDLPQYQSLIRQYLKHMSVAETCMEKFDNEFLKDLSELEQDMITNMTEDGAKVKQAQLQQRLASLCANDKISKYNKIRLIMLYLIGQGDLGAARKQLLESAKVSMDESRCMLHLKYLGVDVHAKHHTTPQRQEQFVQRMKSTSLQLMRFVPALEALIKEMADDSMSKVDYPYTKEPPPKPDEVDNSRASSNVASARRNRRGNWRERGNKEQEQKKEESKAVTGPRQMIFVLGGTTLSEVRSVYEVANSHDANLLIGSTELLTPQKFIDAMMGDKEQEDDDDDDDGGAKGGRVGVKIEKL